MKIIQEMSTDEIVFVDLDVSTLIESRESDRCNSSHFELFVEETLEDELSKSLCIRSCIEEVGEDHVLHELDGSTTCMPFGTGTNLFSEEEIESRAGI